MRAGCDAMPLPDFDAVMRVEAVEYARSRVVVQGMAQTVEVRVKRVDGAELRWFMVERDAPRVGDIFTVTARAGDHAGEDGTETRRVLYHLVHTYDAWRDSLGGVNEFTDDAVRIGRQHLQEIGWWRDA